jgi:hypothetical protein
LLRILPSAHQGAGGAFSIDHVIPRTLGGKTDLANLALSCPHCNAHKWAHATGIDPETDQAVALYHPRDQVWSDHFQWSAVNRVELQGKTPCGRATVARLQMNHPDVLVVRGLLLDLGIFPEPSA